MCFIILFFLVYVVYLEFKPPSLSRMIKYELNRWWMTSVEVCKSLWDSYHYPPVFLDLRTDRSTSAVMYSTLSEVFGGSGQILTLSCSSSERREKLTGFYLTSSEMSFSIKHECKCEIPPVCRKRECSGRWLLVLSLSITLFLWSVLCVCRLTFTRPNLHDQLSFPD